MGGRLAGWCAMGARFSLRSRLASYLVILIEDNKTEVGKPSYSISG